MYKVLSFGAHPDDIEIGCGGTEIKLQKNGCKLYHAIMTSGEEGSPDTTPEKLAEIREKEALAAAKILGVEETKFFRFPDGISFFNKSMRKEVIQYIRNINPDIIFLHGSSDHSYDHKVVYNLITSAIGPSQGPWYPELTQISPRLKAVFGYEVWNPINAPGLHIDISSSMNEKMQALKEHKSQLSTIDYDRAIKGLNQFRGALTGKGEYVESFEIFEISSISNTSNFGFPTDSIKIVRVFS